VFPRERTFPFPEANTGSDPIQQATAATIDVINAVGEVGSGVQARMPLVH
jgi:hypothetical protein